MFKVIEIGKIDSLCQLDAEAVLYFQLLASRSFLSRELLMALDSTAGADLADAGSILYRFSASVWLIPMWVTSLMKTSTSLALLI
jgi:hypothetical protein